MPIHDWTLVRAGVFHDFHQEWAVCIKRALNGGILPPGYYAMVEQASLDRFPDVLNRTPTLSAATAWWLLTTRGTLSLSLRSCHPAINQAEPSSTQSSTRHCGFFAPEFIC